MIRKATPDSEAKQMTFGDKIEAIKADLIIMVREFNADHSYAAAMRCQAAILAVENIYGDTDCHEWPWPDAETEGKQP